jgi:hypothetical protein
LLIQLWLEEVEQLEQVIMILVEEEVEQVV